MHPIAVWLVLQGWRSVEQHNSHEKNLRVAVLEKLGQPTICVRGRNVRYLLDKWVIPAERAHPDRRAWRDLDWEDWPASELERVYDIINGINGQVVVTDRLSPRSASWT